MRPHAALSRMKAEAVAAFREQYRQSEIPPGYCPRCHLLFTFGVGGLALLACLWLGRGAEGWQWLTLPLALVYANLAEYFGHRYPMHRPFPGLRLIYRRHAGQHHRFFSEQQMPFDDLRDLRAVLFPPVLVLFFFGGFGLPAWWLLAWLFDAHVAWLFIAGGIAYFLNYEVLHLAYHLPPGHWLARRALVRRLYWLHALHHDPAQMAQANFNISYPLGDWLFGTLRRKRPDAGQS